MAKIRAQDCAVPDAVQPFLPLTGCCSSLQGKLQLPAPPWACQVALRCTSTPLNFPAGELPAGQTQVLLPCRGLPALGLDG